MYTTIEISTTNNNPYKVQSYVRNQLNECNTSLRLFALKLMKNRFDANDLYQETVLKIIGNVEKYSKESNFKTWALTVMRNIFIDNYRKTKRRRNIQSERPNSFMHYTSNRIINGEGETTLAYIEISKIVNTLPEELKTPFWMSVEGYKYQEIAYKLETSIASIKTRIFLARKALRNMEVLRSYVL